MSSKDLLKGKKPFKVTSELREKIINIIKEALRGEDRVLLVILFGGFLEQEYTRDIDLALYVREPGDILDDYGYAEELAERLSKKTGYPIDIVILNHASDYLFNTVMLSGKPLIVRDYRLYYGLRLLAIDQRNFFRSLYRK